MPKSVENTYSVHSACKSTSATPFNIDFDILIPSSFQGNEGPFKSCEIEGPCFRHSNSLNLASNACSTVRAPDPSALCIEEKGQQSRTLVRVAPAECTIPEYLSSTLEQSTDDPRYLAVGYREKCNSSSASAPGDHPRNSLFDTSPNTSNIAQGAQTMEYVRYCSAGAAHDVESSCTSPMSSAMPVSVVDRSTSWDERFLRLERISPDAVILLEFLCTLQPGEIPEIVFCRMWTSRECWSCDGEIERVNIPLSAPLIDLVTRPSLFHEHARLLESFGFIKSEPGPLGKRKFSIEPDFRDRMTGIIRNFREVQWLRLVLVCHSFPGRLEEIGSVSCVLNLLDC